MIAAVRETAPRARLLELDVFRGVAILMMIVFHFLYDLHFYQLAKFRLFSNPFWLVYRETLVFLFLGVVGVCLFLEHRNGIRWRPYWRRFLRITAGAALVTVTTYLYDPKRVVLFGVLQLILVSSLLALPFLRRKSLCLTFALFLLAFGHIGDLNESRHYVPYLTWIGFGALRVRAFEIFPFIPYFGYVLLGIYLASFVFKNGQNYLFVRLNSESRRNFFLSFLGRHSLLIYLAHRPISLGIVYLMAA